jgi:hypothetical protein
VYVEFFNHDNVPSYEEIIGTLSLKGIDAQTIIHAADYSQELEKGEKSIRNRLSLQQKRNKKG